MTHLWEADHPYYCSDTNYFASPDKTITRYESWSDFASQWTDFDVDLNLIFRWDWVGDELSIYRMAQRKGLFTCQLVKVTKADEADIREYLRPHLQRLMENWAPMLESEPVLATHYSDERIEAIRVAAVRAAIAGEVSWQEATRRVQRAQEDRRSDV